MEPSPSLPSTRLFLQQLISALPATTHKTTHTNVTVSSTTNPTSEQPPSPDLQSILLTLHVLFPNELLPALDLLDRNLITRLTIPPNSFTSANHRQPTIHLVQSAQPPRNTHLSKYHAHHERHLQHHHHQTRYEVRLKAWSCSCPAFAFAAFPAVAANAANANAEPVSRVTVWSASEEAERAEWEWGGLSLLSGKGGEGAPVCKHLLACVLAEYGGWCGGEGVAVQERVVSVEEMAGWCAGWGD